MQSPDNPDYCIIDLDPDKNTFDQVIEAALEVKKVLDAIDVPSTAKHRALQGCIFIFRWVPNMIMTSRKCLPGSL
jgi:DNA primase